MPVFLGLSLPAQALRIIPHITEGPAALAGLTAKLSGPLPLLDGSPTALDCRAVGALLGDAIDTTETGALCSAIADWERHVKDDVTVEFEFYKLDILRAFGLSGILGGAFVEVVWLAPPERLSLRGRHGYDAMLRILKSKARQEADADRITSYLPNYAALEMTLPDDPFFNDNPDFRDGRWKPVSLAITRAQIKALGYDPRRFRRTLIEDPQDFFRSVPDIDGVFVLNDERGDDSLLFDLDPTEAGPLAGPFALDAYADFDFTDPGTLPAGFIVDPRIVDFQGIIKHELGHLLGVISAVDLLGDYPDTARIMQTVTPMDLYRIAENDLAAVHRPWDFWRMPRHWIAEGDNGRCAVETGNAVMVSAIDRNLVEMIPLASGLGGDNEQANHIRAPYNEVVENPDDCSGALITYQFLKERPFPLMRPGQGAHLRLDFSPEDLRLFDLLGWDIDYQGRQSTSLEDGAEPAPAAPLQSLEVRAARENLEVRRSLRLLLE